MKRSGFSESAISAVWLFQSTSPPHIREQEASGSGYYIHTSGASVSQGVNDGMGRGHSKSSSSFLPGV